MAIELAETPQVPDDSAVSRRPPARYSVLRDGSTTPEIFLADSDEEALKRIRAQVRTGGCKVIYLYKLLACEAFEPSSVTLTGDALDLHFPTVFQPRSEIDQTL